MYHALSVAKTDEKLKESLDKVDKFAAIAPCLYLGPPIKESELKSFREITVDNIKAYNSSGYDFIFGE